MLTIPWLDDDAEFPPINQALVEPNGLLAVGGDLNPARLLKAYASGIFPWYEEGQPILWWSPDPRMCLHPSEMHLSRSLHKTLRRGAFRVTMDQAFDRIIGLCADTRAEGTWISPEMQMAYIQLHRLGHAHSVEVWHDETLSGGLYGVSLGALFFGESMVSLHSNASKIAFAALCLQLNRWEFRLIDCQMPTAHLFTLGAQKMPRHDFERLLKSHASPLRPGPWQLDEDLFSNPDTSGNLT